MIRVEYAPRKARGEGRLSESEVKRIAQGVSKTLKLKEDFTVSVALVDRPTIQHLNKTFRGKDAVTDVLAFQYDEPGNFGEVIICPARAREQAKEVKRPIKEEVIELLIHGFLHVFGYDHIKPSDAKKMLPLQQTILETLV